MFSPDIVTSRFSRRNLLGAAVVIAAGARLHPKSAAADSWFDVYATTNWDGDTNVRSDAGEGGDWLGSFGPGSTVLLLGGPTADGWYYVQSAEGGVNLEGWVAGWLLLFEQTATVIEDAPFFDQPGSWSSELGWFRHNFAVTLLGPVNGEFILARSGGRSGFVSIWSLEASGRPETDPYAEWWVDVDRTTAEVRLMVGEAVVDRFDASVSKDTGEGFYSTAIGTYWIYQKIEDLTFTPYADAYFRYWAGFDEERYNGFHSWTMDSDGNVLNGGWGTTAGCVATEPEHAATIFRFVEIGTRVEIHW